MSAGPTTNLLPSTTRFSLTAIVRSYDHPIRNSSWPIASGLTDPLLPGSEQSNNFDSAFSLYLSLFLSNPFSTIFKDRHVLSFTIQSFFDRLSFLHSTIFYNIIAGLLSPNPKRIRLENVLSSSSSTSGKKNRFEIYFF